MDDPAGLTAGNGMYRGALDPEQEPPFYFSSTFSFKLARPRQYLRVAVLVRLPILSDENHRTPG